MILDEAKRIVKSTIKKVGSEDKTFIGIARDVLAIERNRPDVAIALSTLVIHLGNERSDSFIFEEIKKTNCIGASSIRLVKTH